MNKLTKVGLTALATSLVSTASIAGELSVSGSAALTYTGLDSATDTNPWVMADSVKFSGSGDLDNGMTVSVYYEIDRGYSDAYDDYNLTKMVVLLTVVYLIVQVTLKLVSGVTM